MSKDVTFEDLRLITAPHRVFPIWEIRQLAVNAVLRDWNLLIELAISNSDPMEAGAFATFLNDDLATNRAGRMAGSLISLSHLFSMDTFIDLRGEVMAGSVQDYQSAHPVPAGLRVDELTALISIASLRTGAVLHMMNKQDDLDPGGITVVLIDFFNGLSECLMGFCSLYSIDLPKAVRRETLRLRVKVTESFAGLRFNPPPAHQSYVLRVNVGVEKPLDGLGPVAYHVTWVARQLTTELARFITTLPKSRAQCVEHVERAGREVEEKRPASHPHALNFANPLAYSFVDSRPLANPLTPTGASSFSGQYESDLISRDKAVLLSQLYSLVGDHTAHNGRAFFLTIETGVAPGREDEKAETYLSWVAKGVKKDKVLASGVDDIPNSATGIKDLLDSIKDMVSLSTGGGSVYE